MPSENHKRFLFRLDESEHGRLLVAQWMQDEGYTILIPPLRKAPEADQWRDYSDKGDLLVMARIEVKQLGVAFTSRDDWPYRPDFIVCSRGSYERANPKPYAYFILSSTGTHVAMVHGDSKPVWTVGRRYDKELGLWQEFYFAPLRWVTFRGVNLKQREP